MREEKRKKRRGKNRERRKLGMEQQKRKKQAPACIETVTALLRRVGLLSYRRHGALNLFHMTLTCASHPLGQVT